MVFGQPPCRAGRVKRRRVHYLGLLGPATNGQCDITDLCTARFGHPRPGQKVFIVTCQQKKRLTHLEVRTTGWLVDFAETTEHFCGPSPILRSMVSAKIAFEVDCLRNVAVR